MGSDTPTEHPLWITTDRGPDGKPGVPPVADLKENPVTDDEIAAQVRRNETDIAEALALYKSTGRDMATGDQRFIGQHQTNADIHRANLEVFEAELRKGPSAALVHQVIHHAQALAYALIHLGQFDDAIVAIESIGGFEADHLRRLVTDYKAADKRPNEEECECEPPSTDEHIDFRGNAIPKKIVVRKHFRAGHFRSATQGRVVAVHTCGTCGHQNAYPTNDAEHAQLLAARQAAEHNVRIANLKGHQARAHLQSLGHHGDEVHLAVPDDEAVVSGLKETVISQ